MKQKELLALAADIMESQKLLEEMAEKLSKAEPFEGQGLSEAFQTELHINFQLVKKYLAEAPTSK